MSYLDNTTTKYCSCLTVLSPKEQRQAKARQGKASQALVIARIGKNNDVIHRNIKETSTKVALNFQSYSLINH
jgi:hypothetical protein